MTCVIVGASSGLGRALAEAFAAAGHDLVIVSSDLRDLQALASDLTIRRNVRVVSVDADLGADGDFSRRIAEAAFSLGEVHALMFPVGASIPADGADIAPAEAERLLRTNFLSIVSIVGEFLPSLRSRSRGVIVGFGSVAASRGRSANIIYSAAKRALASYFESLRHANVDYKIIIQYYVLGYMDTNLAFGIRTPLPKSDVGRISRRVLDNRNRDFGVAYYPGFWRYICLALRLVPWFVFKRLKF